MTFHLSRIRDFLRYDPETGEFAWIKTPGHRPRAGLKAGKMTRGGYVQIGFGGKHHMAHRLAWFFVHGEMPSSFLDHINGDRADNRIANLRPATREQNAQNRVGPRNKSLPKGVSISLTRTGEQRYRARIGAGRERYNIGIYATVEEAQFAYATAAAQLHGEYARAA